VVVIESEKFQVEGQNPVTRLWPATHRFAGDKEQGFDLLIKVCTGSVETMKIVKEMPA
jgi:hypothetical protein